MEKIKCDECNKRIAKHNMQQSWVHYDYDNKTGNYGEGEIQEECSGDNIHLCDKCYEENW